MGNRINSAMKSAGLTQTSLAELMGVTPQAVQKWVKAGNGPKGSRLAKLASILKVNANWIITGEGEKYPNQPYTDLIAAPPIKGKVPLFSFAQVGGWGEAEFNLPSAIGVEMVDTRIEVKTRTFAVKVSGDSMEPEFSPNGDVVIIEPDLPYDPDDYVLAKKGSDVFIRQIANEGGDWLLKPCNKDYKPKPIDEYQIIGVVRGKQKSYK